MLVTWDFENCFITFFKKLIITQFNEHAWKDYLKKQTTPETLLCKS